MLLFIDQGWFREPCFRELRSSSQGCMPCVASIASWWRYLQMCRCQTLIGRPDTLYMNYCASKKTDLILQVSCTSYFMLYNFSKNDWESFRWLCFYWLSEKWESRRSGVWVGQRDARQSNQVNRGAMASMLEVPWDSVRFICSVAPTNLTVWKVGVLFSLLSRQLIIT